MTAASPIAATANPSPRLPLAGATHHEVVKPEPALIVVGTDRRGRWRAAWFSQAQVEVASKAAAAIGLKALPATDGTIRDLAVELRPGQVFKSGRALIPFAPKALHTRLQALAGPSAARSDLSTTPPFPAAQGAAAGGSSSPTAKTSGKVKPRYPRSWEGIVIGSLVLISEGEQDGWYEAEVVASKPGGEFTLKWRDWPELPLLVRRREEMAPLHPNASEAAGA